MGDFYCKCTRCRNKHKESERPESQPDADGIRTLLCPRCRGKNYFRLDDVETIEQAQKMPEAD